MLSRTCIRQTPLEQVQQPASVCQGNHIAWTPHLEPCGCPLQQYWADDTRAYRFVPVAEFARAFEESRAGQAALSSSTEEVPLPCAAHSKQDPLVRSRYARSHLFTSPSKQRRGPCCVGGAGAQPPPWSATHAACKSPMPGRLASSHPFPNPALSCQRSRHSKPFPCVSGGL